MTTDNAELIEQLQKESFLTRLVCTEIADQVADLIDRAIAALTAQVQAEPVAIKRWPFVETPGEFARRLDEARQFFGNTLSAVRCVLIERPPLYAHPQPASVGDKTTPTEPAPVQAELTNEQMHDLVKSCGLDWQRGYMPLFAGDPTNRYGVLIEAAIAADRALRQPLPAAMEGK